jgi:spore coat protein D
MPAPAPTAVAGVQSNALPPGNNMPPNMGPGMMGPGMGPGMMGPGMGQGMGPGMMGPGMGQGMGPGMAPGQFPRPRRFR